MLKVGIIGAGIAGVTCAYACQKKGYDVILFDKSRGVGGRSSSKFWDESIGLTIDMGIPYITEDEFLQIPKSLQTVLLSTNTVKQWSLLQQTNTSISSMSTFVGVPKMTAITQRLAQDISLMTQQKIIDVSYDKQWRVTSDTHQSWVVDKLVLALPAAQYELLSGLPNELRQFVSSISYQAINTCLIECDSPLWSSSYHIDNPNHDYMQTVIADYLKPERQLNRYTYAIHAAQRWSTQTFSHLTKDEVKDMMISFCLNYYQHSSKIILNSLCHRWKYAIVDSPQLSLTDSFYVNQNQTLFACGDWCLSNSYVAALKSGWSLAQYL